MFWARMLAYVTGRVEEELLLRNEYLAAENRILKAQIKGRLLLSEEEKTTLAEIAHRLGPKALRAEIRERKRNENSPEVLSNFRAVVFSGSELRYESFLRLQKSKRSFFR